ncbi:MAG: SPASM domain-containing protein [Bacteroides sp.]|nr:SPASM domain-containing protein [Bacteroides sp.]
MEFSIFSSRPEIHDEITRKPGSWEIAVENMRSMLSNDIPVTPVVVVTRLNHKYIEETVQFFYKMGIQSVMINRYNLGGEGLNHPNKLSPDSSQLRQALTVLNHFAEETGMRVLSGVCTPHCVLNPDDYSFVRFGSCSDDVYRRPLTFDLEGNLRLCNHSPVYAGNIYKQSLGEIIASSYVEEWSDLQLSFCQSCTRLLKCKGGCRAASEQMGLSLKHEDPIIHELKSTPFV